MYACMDDIAALLKVMHELTGSSHTAVLYAIATSTNGFWQWGRKEIVTAATLQDVGHATADGCEHSVHQISV